MIRWAAFFAVLAAVTAYVGFMVLAGLLAVIAKFVAFVFLALLVALLFAGLKARRRLRSSTSRGDSLP